MIGAAPKNVLALATDETSKFILPRVLPAGGTIVTTTEEARRLLSDRTASFDCFRTTTGQDLQDREGALIGLNMLPTLINEAELREGVGGTLVLTVFHLCNETRANLTALQAAAPNLKIIIIRPENEAPYWIQWKAGKGIRPEMIINP